MDAKPNGHELAKRRRRVRIVSATMMLLREVELEALSITLVAEHAGVSPATVYNLFGNKSSVLKSVFDQDLAHFQAVFNERSGADGLDNFFIALDVATELYDEQPGLYRAMMYVSGREGNLYAEISKPRVDFWCRLVAAARQSGRLRRDTDDAETGATLSFLARGGLSHWAEGMITTDELRRKLKVGFSLVLAAVAKPESAARLRALRQASLARLQAD
ncbi:TetR/AcrR family transcriptional regulator [Chelatococcus reniformis]|uniref:HTH tetR-type domain-containing protein n=1 Tax=Chelatococcus reniformis TaxID=1494448 RepID=A0A916UVM4_9HYPH|nr:TetR/AcrR family transcriptional regulator [Chelatococcus reniformis]GGC87323.1 hypothetical protein GCM10010994_51590 [Chelatococcus reniformis]